MASATIRASEGVLLCTRLVLFAMQLLRQRSLRKSIALVNVRIERQAVTLDIPWSLHVLSVVFRLLLDTKTKRGIVHLNVLARRWVALCVVRIIRLIKGAWLPQMVM